jgi:hypothetical protein
MTAAELAARVRRAALLPVLLVVLVVVFVVALVGGAALSAVLYAATAMPASAFARFRNRAAVAAAFDSMRWPVAYALVRNLGPMARPAHARAFMALMASRETPTTWDGGSAIVGDETLPGGPSVGPCQVYRATARDERAWVPPPDVAGDDAWERVVYGSVANNLAKCIDMGAVTFARKLRAAKGDLTDAIRRYNGGKTSDRNGNGIPDSVEYRDAVVAFADATWGAGSLAITSEAA